MEKLRWVGWKRITDRDDLEALVENPAAYYTKRHAVRGNVGGWADQGHGEAGKAVCGAAIPADNPDEIAGWITAGNEVPVCRRCQAIAIGDLPWPWEPTQRGGA